MGVVKSFPQDQLHIANCQSFCNEVEELVQNSNKQADEKEALDGKKRIRLGYVDAVLAVAEKRKIEPDLAATYVSPELKAKMQIEWENKHMLPRTARLPF